MDFCATQAGAYLHHLAFTSPDPEALARFYGDAMDITTLHARSEEREA